MNISILTVLLLSCYNITILNFIQIIFLILSILIWIFLLFYFIYKFLLIVLGKLSDEDKFRKFWRIANFPAFSIIGISILYDLIKSNKNGMVWLISYFLNFMFLCIIFIILTLFDYFGIKKQIEMSLKKSKAILLKDIQDPSFSSENDTQDNKKIN